MPHPASAACTVPTAPFCWIVALVVLSGHGLTLCGVQAVLPLICSIPESRFWHSSLASIVVNLQCACDLHLAVLLCHAKQGVGPQSETSVTY